MKLKFSLEVKKMKRFLSIKVILLICLLGAIVFLIGCTPSVSINTGTVKGVINVYWPGVGYVPSAARVDVFDEGIFTVSSFSDGSYTLNNVPVGQYTITVFKHGYVSTQQVINVVENQTITNVDFNLETIESIDQLGGTYYFGINLDEAPFNNLKVRQALNYAIDKEALVNEINSEFVTNRVVAQGLIPPSIMGYNSSLAGYSYDVAEAQVLLSQAGYPEGFNTDLYYNILDSGFHYFVAQKIQTYLAQVGINTELHGIEWAQFLAMLDQDELPFFRAGWSFDTPDPTDAFYCLYHSAGPDNSSHYHNPAVDSQIEQAWATIDEANFVQLIQQIESTIVDDAPAIYIYHY
jgi:ABC-type transport system substrate-binding protein